jgi:peptidoglycan biosynthesis protein MviN/MurJ (putative lipid II flippase)
MAPPTETSERLPGALVGLGLLLYAVAGAGTALIETLLVPLRNGTTLLPLAVPLAILSNAVLPRLSRRLNDSVWGAAIPALTWMVTVVLLLSPRREGDVILPGSPTDVMLVSYGVLFGGILAAVLTVAMTNPTRHQRADGIQRGAIR